MDYLESLDISDGTDWKADKTLRLTKPTSHYLDGQLVYSTRHKAEAFAGTMEDQFTPHQSIFYDNTEDLVEAFMDDYFNEDQQEANKMAAHLAPFPKIEVASMVSRVRTRKAAGLDKIGAKALIFPT